MERRPPRRDGLQREVLVPKELVTWANKKFAAVKTSSLGLARAVAAVKRRVRGFRKTASRRVGFVGAQQGWHVAKEAERLVPGPFCDSRSTGTYMCCSSTLSCGTMCARTQSYNGSVP